MFWQDAQRISDWTAELKGIYSEISELLNRAEVIVNELGKRDVADRDGARSMVDWVSSTLDISRTNAADLVYAKKFTRHRHIERRFVDGDISFDRALTTLRLAEAGADSHTVEASYGLDLNTVSRMTTRQRRLERVDEATAFQERYCNTQPTLDESSWMVSGRLPGVEGRVLAKALAQRADEFPTSPEERHRRGHSDRPTPSWRWRTTRSIGTTPGPTQPAPTSPSSSTSILPTAPAARSALRSSTALEWAPTPSTNCSAPVRCR